LVRVIFALYEDMAYIFFVRMNFVFVFFGQFFKGPVGKKLRFLLIFEKFMKNGACFVFTACSKSL
jgi:hypothetical protein